MPIIIDLAKAKRLIQEYRKQNSTVGGPALITPEKKFLHGFFIDRQSIEDTLSNAGVVGISVEFAKHPDFLGVAENVFTLVYTGAAPAPAGSSAPYVNTGHIYCDPPPCPPFCVKL